MWKFTYNPEIAVNAMLLLCNRAAEKGNDLSFMQMAKLLFYADKFHLKKYGRPITGDIYMSMEHGPNPSLIYEYLKSVRSKPGQSDHFIRVDLRPNPPHNPVPYVLPLVEHDKSIFSETDLEILEEVFSKLGGKSAKELRDMSHEETAWKNAEFEMSFEDFLDEEDGEIRKYIDESQADWEKLGHLVKNG